MRWQNGGGSTREVAGEPAGAALDAFDWRISVADVGEGGPFSRFEGVDRVLVLVDGPGMTLTVDGTRHELRRYEPFRFDGGAATTCELPGGPTRDVNVMTRRGRCTAVTEVLHPGAEGTVVSGGHPLVLLALAGPVRVTAPEGAEVELGDMDALCRPGPSAVSLHGPGTVAAVRLAPVQ